MGDLTNLDDRDQVLKDCISLMADEEGISAIKALTHEERIDFLMENQIIKITKTK